MGTEARWSVHHRHVSMLQRKAGWVGDVPLSQRRRWRWPQRPLPRRSRFGALSLNLDVGGRREMGVLRVVLMPTMSSSSVSSEMGLAPEPRCRDLRAATFQDSMSGGAVEAVEGVCLWPALGAGAAEATSVVVTEWTSSDAAAPGGLVMAIVVMGLRRRFEGVNRIVTGASDDREMGSEIGNLLSLISGRRES